MRPTNFFSRRRGERGSVLLEMAMTLPLLLLVAVGIFELGRAYQTEQILTNAAREGARMAVLPNASASNIASRVKGYLQSGQLSNYQNATVSVTPDAVLSINGTNVRASIVTVSYPFSFMVLNPIVRLVVSGSTLGAPITLTASSEMRNESQF